MTIIALDVSKNELVGVVTDKHGKVKSSFDLDNTECAIDKWFKYLNLEYGGKKLVIGAEATAQYHRYVALKTVELGFAFRLINPILTNQFTRATIRKKKTDLSDAAIIAKLISQGEGTIVTSELLSSDKSIYRMSTTIDGLRKTLVAIQKHIDDHFKQQNKISDRLNKPINILEDTVKILRCNIEKKVDFKLKNLLKSIPGVGDKIATTMILEIGNISRFKNVKGLIAYSGLDPKVNQSGRGLNRNTKLTKRGSPYLRRAAYIAAYISAKHDKELSEYWHKKRDEGKRYKEATVATARKILYRVYAVWKRGTPYITTD